MKTPSYRKRAVDAYRERKRNQGYKNYNVLVPPEVYDKLKAYHQQLKVEQV